MAHESPNPWTITLPSVLLRSVLLRSAVKELLGRSAAEIIYGTTLRLPGEFTEKYTIDAHTNLDNYSDKLRVAMSRLRLCPPRDTHQENIFQYKEIDTCTHVFLRRIAIAPPLTAPYDGPYKVIVRSRRVMKILIKGKVETVSLDRVKPAHFECKPAAGTITQRTMPSKRTSLKTTGIVRRNSQDPLTPSSTHTQMSNRTSVKPTTTKSKATKHGTNLATTPQPKAIRVKLPNKFKPYVALHSRTSEVSRANGSDGGLQTYSRVPLHLRDKTPPTSGTRKQSNAKDDSTMADSDTVKADGLRGRLELDEQSKLRPVCADGPCRSGA